MTKNEMIVEAQQILPILSPAEVEELWEMLDYVADEPEPEGFFPSKAEMIDVVAWRLCKCTQKQIKAYLTEIKQVAEMRLKRRHEIMQALSSAGLTNVQTDVSVPADKDQWSTCLALVFSDRYGCLASKSGFNGDHGAGESWENICFYGDPILASVCGRNFEKSQRFSLEMCRKIAEDARKSGSCADKIDAMCNAYGFGFCNGVRETFAAQWRDELKQGLYLAAPQAIREYKELLEEEGNDFIMCPDLSAGKYGSLYMDGVRDGHKSAPTEHP